MCREWPFIKPVLADITNWEIMAGSCPGIHTNFPDEIIKTIIEKELSIFQEELNTEIPFFKQKEYQNETVIK